MCPISISPRSEDASDDDAGAAAAAAAKPKLFSTFEVEKCRLQKHQGFLLNLVVFGLCALHIWVWDCLRDGLI